LEDGMKIHFIFILLFCYFKFEINHTSFCDVFLKYIIETNKALQVVVQKRFKARMKQFEEIAASYEKKWLEQLKQDAKTRPQLNLKLNITGHRRNFSFPITLLQHIPEISGDGTDRSD
jgi:hypothetical protein